MNQQFIYYIFQMNELYKEKLREARHVDSSEGTAESLDASTFINSRY